MVFYDAEAEQQQLKCVVTNSRHVFQRDADLDLRNVQNELPSGTRYLHIYCGNLGYGAAPVDGIVSIDIPGSSELRYITIFTCTFLGRIDVKGFKITAAKKVKVRLYFEVVPPQLFFVGAGQPRRIIARDDPIFDFDGVTDADESAKTTKADFKKELQKQIDLADTLDSNKEIVGFFLTVSNAAATVKTIDRVPASEFQRVRPTAKFTDLSLDPQSSAFNNLAYLLNYLFSEACVLVFNGLAMRDSTDKDKAELKAMRYLSFVCRCTSNCPEYSALREDAATLLQRLELPRRYPVQEQPEMIIGRYIVPIDSHVKYKASLDAAMKNCETVQQSVDALASETRITKEFRDVSATSLNAVAVLGLGIIPNDKHYDAMLSSSSMVLLRKSEMEDRANNLKHRQKEFEAGLDDYQNKKGKERDMAMLAGAGEIAFQLVLALCTNPAAAVPTITDIAATVKEVVEEAAKEDASESVEKSATDSSAAKTVTDDKKDKKAPPAQSKASHVLKKVGPTAASAGLKMYKAWKSYENNQVLKGRAEESKRQAAASRINQAVAAVADAITTSSPRIDYLGLMADWAEIKTGVAEMFETLEFKLAGEKIIGLEEYRTALNNMITRGQTLLEAQRQFQEDIGTYYRGVAETELRENRVEEIKAAAQEIKDKELPFAGFIGDLRASIVVMRRTVVLHIHRYLLSLKYRSSRYNYLAAKAAPDINVKKLRDAVQELDKQVEARDQGSQNEQDTPKIQIATDDANQNIFDPDWKGCLTQFKEIPFTVPYNHDEAKRFYDLRILSISAQFIREDGVPFQKVQYEISIGPQFIDRDEQGKLHQYYAGEFDIVKSTASG